MAGKLDRIIAAAKSGVRRYPRELLASLRSPTAPLVTPDNGGDASSPVEEGGVVWLGHATVLMRLGGKTILTDPVLSDRIGPRLIGRTFGIPRIAPLPLTPEQLGPVDVMLLSHAHFDHLDRPSLAALRSTRTTVVTALRTAGLVPKGFRRVVELGWGKSIRIGGLTIRSIRPEHWGARTALDARRGYNAYLLESGDRRVLFGGDTALTDAFDELGPIDLAILGIGAYESWDHRHATPEQAWKMFNRMRGECLLPMHHATFDLGEPHPDEPMERLVDAAGARADRIVIHRPGDGWTPVSGG